jgi:hypothetical protein
MTTLAAPLILFVLTLATPARAQNVNPPDFCPQPAALVRYFADARDQASSQSVPSST